MQAHGAARGGVGTPVSRSGGRLGGLVALAAILVIVAVMAAMTWGMGAPATGGAGTENANLNAGVVDEGRTHDDAGNMPLATGTGSTVVHDDAGNVKP